MDKKNSGKAIVLGGLLLLLLILLKKKTPSNKLTIVERTLPDGVVGQVYGPEYIEVTGGTPPYDFRILNGYPPEGIVFDLERLFYYGVPKKAGTITQEMFVDDSADNRAFGTFTIKINPAPILPLKITTESLPIGHTDQHYPTITIAAEGGMEPLHVTFISGHLPDNLTWMYGQIIETGFGYPNPPGDYPLTFRVTDYLGNMVDKDFILTVV